MTSEINQPVKTFAVDQRFEIGADQNIRRRLAGLRITLDPDRIVRSGHGKVTNMGFKRQNLLLARAFGCEIHGHKGCVIHRDPDLLDRCDQKIGVSVLAQDR